MKPDWIQFARTVLYVFPLIWLIEMRPIGFGGQTKPYHCFGHAPRVRSNVFFTLGLPFAFGETPWLMDETSSLSREPRLG